MIDDSAYGYEPDHQRPRPVLSPELAKNLQSEEVESAGREFFNAIARRIIEEIAPTPIAGMHLYITGNGPFSETQLKLYFQGDRACHAARLSSLSATA